VPHRLQDTTAQIRVRAAFVLLIGFTALADSVGLKRSCDLARPACSAAATAPRG
jgi:hypothetical protein